MSEKLTKEEKELIRTMKHACDEARDTSFNEWLALGRPVSGVPESTLAGLNEYVHLLNGEVWVLADLSKIIQSLADKRIVHVMDMGTQEISGYEYFLVHIEGY